MSHMEGDRMQHGDLVITTDRQADGTIRVRVDPGKEKIYMVMYPNEVGGNIKCPR